MLHEIYMQRALELARRGWGTTNPNPLVGAVIVKNGEIIGEGYHKKPGGASCRNKCSCTSWQKIRRFDFICQP